MTEPLAYLNGQFLAISRLSIPPTDAGFVQGATVAEQLRTFGGSLFRLQAHLKRLARSLEIVHVDPGVSSSQLAEAARRMVDHNHALLAAGDDLGLTIVVTPGPFGTYAPHATPTPLVAMHTYSVPFSLWAGKYRDGQHLVITDVEQVSPRCWPAELKCRSRMHYYLADLKARSIDPQARALLLDHEGFVSEASSANVVAFFEGEGLVSPPRDKILPGISIAVLGELAAEQGIPLLDRDLSPDELPRASEMLLCSTSPCLLPVVRVNDHSIGDGKPGEVFKSLIQAWSDIVGVDIVGQTARFADR